MLSHKISSGKAVKPAAKPIIASPRPIRTKSRSLAGTPRSSPDGQKRGAARGSRVPSVARDRPAHRIAVDGAEAFQNVMDNATRVRSWSCNRPGGDHLGSRIPTPSSVTVARRHTAVMHLTTRSSRVNVDGLMSKLPPMWSDDCADCVSQGPLQRKAQGTRV
jgi:hypothetical protein